jgi:hypothetical protein
MPLSDFQDRLAEGARNLLINCAQCQPGHKLLLIYEAVEDGYYDTKLAGVIKDAAVQFGLESQMHGVPFNRDVSDPDETLLGKIDAADRTVFFARLGDQIRFRPLNSSKRQIISYALDRETLASAFGTIDWRAFERLRSLTNTALAGSTDIHVTCPAGTDFKGNPMAFSEASGDTTLKRFPVSVFTPVPAKGFHGRIAQNGFLTGTGSQYYTPWSCELKETLFVNFENSRITGFEGSAADVSAAKAHYEFVGNKYQIDTYFVHSWHAGIHPGCEYLEPAGRNFERWSGAAFGNPRLLHFHTCGAYPPGEISLNVLDATVRIDGAAVWESGRLHPERLSGGTDLLEAYPDMQTAFQNPTTRVGQAASGKLSYG